MTGHSFSIWFFAQVIVVVSPYNAFNYVINAQFRTHVNRRNDFQTEIYRSVSLILSERPTGCTIHDSYTLNSGNVSLLASCSKLNQLNHPVCNDRIIIACEFTKRSLQGETVSRHSFRTHFVANYTIRNSAFRFNVGVIASSRICRDSWMSVKESVPWNSTLITERK